MGFAVTWYAVESPNGDDLLQRLSLNATGAMEPFPESLITVARPNTG